MSLLLSPQILYSIIAVIFSTAGYLGIRGCSQSDEINSLRAQLITAQQDLQRCTTNQAVIQAELAKQANEINRYNSLASRYKKELDTKYTIPPVLPQEPCKFDFSVANELLTKQGYRR